MSKKSAAKKASGVRIQADLKKIAPLPTAPIAARPPVPKTLGPQPVAEEGATRSYLSLKDFCRAWMEAWAADQTIHDLAETLGESVATLSRRAHTLRKRQKEEGKRLLPTLRRKSGPRGSRIDLDELDQIINEYEEIPEEEKDSIPDPEPGEEEEEEEEVEE